MSATAITKRVRRHPMYSALIALIIMAAAVASVPTQQVPVAQQVAQAFSAEVRASAPKSAISYFVLAHPDDEARSMALIEALSTDYLVFIFMTEGERTFACRPHHADHNRHDSWWEPPTELAPAYGWDPSDTPPHGPNCVLSRRHAALQVLGGLASFSSNFNAHSELSSAVVDGAAWYFGNKMAVAFHNFGDGNLTAGEVEIAVARSRAQRGGLIPDLPERVVVAGAFTNGHPAGPNPYPGCNEYQHADHHAIQRALFDNVGESAQLVRYGVTCRSDADSAPERGGLHLTASVALWDRLFNPNDGLYPVNYGWNLPNSWEARRTEAEVAPGMSGRISAEQAFWRRG